MGYSININNSEKAEVIVMTTQGVEMNRYQNLQSGEHKINLSEYAEGIYFITATVGQQERLFKLMIVK